MILHIRNLYKSFTHASHPEPVEVLQGANLEINKGETVAVVGQSGSGKSTLLSLLAGLDQPSSGSIWLKEKNLADMNEETLAKFRAENIGIIFQQFHLMSHLTALENVSLPLEMAHDKKAILKAEKAMEQVGLSPRMDHFPHQLSGGECQRVAIARALVIQPAILLADEPTGNLDNKTGEQISDSLFDLVRTIGMTLLLVTHNEHLAQRCERQVVLQDGLLR